MPTGGQVSKYSRYPRGEPSSYPSNNPTGSSTIPISEESCKRLTRTTRLVESHLTRVPNTLTQTNISAANIDESALIHAKCDGNVSRESKFSSSSPTSIRRDKPSGRKHQGKQLHKL